MADEKDKKIVGVVKEIVPATKKQDIETSAITIGVSVLSFVIGALTKGPANINEKKSN